MDVICTWKIGCNDSLYVMAIIQVPKETKGYQQYRIYKHGSIQHLHKLSGGLHRTLNWNNQSNPFVTVDSHTKEYWESEGIKSLYGIYVMKRRGESITVYYPISKYHSEVGKSTEGSQVFIRSLLLLLLRLERERRKAKKREYRLI